MRQVSAFEAQIHADPMHTVVPVAGVPFEQVRPTTVQADPTLPALGSQALGMLHPPSASFGAQVHRC